MSDLLSSLQHLLAAGMPLSDSVMCWFARAGHLDCLKYAHEHGADMRRTAFCAASEGHLDCLKYAHLHGECIKNAANIAAANGHLDCLKYAHEHGADMNETATCAAESGHIDCLKYAHEHGADMRHTAKCAALEGHLDCLKYAHEHGAYMRFAAQCAVGKGHLDCLKYAHEHGCEFTIRNLDTVSSKHVACIEYAWKHKCVKELACAPISIRQLVDLLRMDDELQRNYDVARWKDFESHYERYVVKEITHKDFVNGLCDLVGKSKVLYNIAEIQRRARENPTGFRLVARYILLPKWRRACATSRIAAYWLRASKRHKGEYVHKLKRAVLTVECEVSTEWHKSIVTACMRDPMAGPFRKPLNWRALGLWDYPSVVPFPMDLSTMRDKTYRTMDALRADFDLIWDNADAYNGPDSWIVKYTKAMRGVAARELARLPDVYEVVLPAKRARVA